MDERTGGATMSRTKRKKRRLIDHSLVLRDGQIMLVRSKARPLLPEEARRWLIKMAKNSTYGSGKRKV